jgi:MFS transporter, BCD family, chlorophyll transporter
LPLPRLLRLSLFQIAVGMIAALLTGTLNRVMIVEQNVPAWLVSVMVSLPLVFAPLRALIGHSSDEHRSAFGWRRVPFLWYGTMAQFGGLAIMPFALLVMTDTPDAPVWVGYGAVALAFLLVGAGMHTTQTAGLALAGDLAAPQSRPRVVALLYVMLLLGMMGGAVIYGALLSNYSTLRLIQAIQGSAVLVVVLNAVALWKQEPRNRARALAPPDKRSFQASWAILKQDRPVGRLLLAVGLGTAAFSMQDVLLEPYGGEVLKLSVSATSFLTAMTAMGSLLGFGLAASLLAKSFDPHRLAAFGVMIGIIAFSLVIFAAPFDSAILFRIGSFLIGLGGGLFSVGLLTATMDLTGKAQDGGTAQGLALGAWGAVQATAAGAGLALGGALRDGTAALAQSGALGEAMKQTSIGYSVGYHLEIAMLFVALAVLGPLVRRKRTGQSNQFGLAELPG